tara:strand:+ start:2423 stop:3538 length:1116 start_codon:yes stop_codon:yes gene_type:complete
MAYWRLDPINNSSTATITTNAVADLHNIFNGTHTAVSDLTSTSWNTGNCYTVGTVATSAMYQAGTAGGSTTGNYSTWSSYFYGADKFHYAKGQVSGYQPSREVRYYKDDTNKDRWRAFDSSGGNGIPGNSVSQKWMASTSTGVGEIGASYMSQHIIHIIRNDTTFLIWQQVGTTGTADYAYFMIADLEFINGVDDFHFGNASNYCPTVCIAGVHEDTMLADPPTVQTDDDETRFGVSMAPNPDVAGIYRTPQWSDGNNFHFGYQVNQNYYGSLWPKPLTSMHNLKNSAGDVYPLTPVFFDASNNATNNYSGTRQGKLMNVYRTTDNLDVGARIQVGSTYYRCLPLHPTGRETLILAPKRSTYAFPENNVAY